MFTEWLVCAKHCSHCFGGLYYLILSRECEIDTICHSLFYVAISKISRAESLIKKSGLFTALEGGSPSLRSDVGTEGREGKRRERKNHRMWREARGSQGCSVIVLLLVMNSSCLMPNIVLVQ